MKGWPGVEVQPVSTITRFPKVKIDRVQVRYYETVQHTGLFVTEGSIAGSDIWYPLCLPTADRSAAWMQKEAFERLFTMERRNYEKEQERQRWQRLQGK